MKNYIKNRATHKNTWQALLTALLLIEATVLTAHSRQIVEPIPTTGTVVSIGVDLHWYANQTQPVTNISWGRLYPGDNKTVIIHITASGNEPGNLTLWTADWVPPTTDQYLTLTWNYTDQILSPNDTIPVNITLHINPDTKDVHDFSFTIGIGITDLHS